MQALFRRYRRPGDIVFAWAFVAFSAFLLWRLPDQTAAQTGGRLVAQPWFWPAVSLTGMTIFAVLHLIGSALSERIMGRWREVLTWARSLEFAGWFLGYALLVPQLGYLPATLAFALALVARAGYRDRATYLWAGVAAVAIVVLFRGLLQVKLPAGALYDHLPDGIRQVFLTYL